MGAGPVADGCFRADRKQVEEVVVFQLTNNGGMGENSPISSIVVWGCVGDVGGVGGPGSQRGARRTTPWVNVFRPLPLMASRMTVQRSSFDPLVSWAALGR